MASAGSKKYKIKNENITQTRFISVVFCNSNSVSFLLMQNQFVWLKEFPKDLFSIVWYFKFWNGVGC